jgi:hypothetical protein
MKNSEDGQQNEKIEEVDSFKGAMYTSIIFVGGGIVIFWLMLFIAYSLRL